jgi:hypothetical protein
MKRPMLTAIVRHQLIGHAVGIPRVVVRRNRTTAMTATLARTFRTEIHKGAGGRHRFTIAAGRSATEPRKQIRPRASQYTRRRALGSQSAEAVTCTAHVKLGTIMPTVRTTGRVECTAAGASEPEKTAVMAAPAANHPAVWRWEYPAGNASLEY